MKSNKNKLIDRQFKFQRVLALIIIVVLLAFVYFIVRSDFSAPTNDLSGPVIRSDHALTYEDINHNWGGSTWLVIEDPEDSVSVQIRDSVELMLESLGQEPVYVTDPSIQQIYGAEEGIIVTATYLNKIDEIYTLLDFAKDGGTLIFAVRPEVNETFKSISQQLGIYEHYYFKDSEGIHFIPGMYSDETYGVEGEWLYNSIIELHVYEECNVMAENDEGIPLAWSLSYGQGKILVLNNSLMIYRSSGGMLLSMLAYLEGQLLYPVVNAKVFALESFPAPTDVNQDFIKKHYLRTGRTFLRDLWWPDMLQIGLSNQLKFTAGFMTGYDTEAAISSITVLREDMDLVYYSKELSRYGGEIAFTGFNQKPLLFSENAELLTYEPWSDVSMAYERTESALSLFREYYSNYTIYSYLPTNRMLDQEGYEIIKELLPDLQVISGDFNDRNRWYQEFGVNEDGIVNLPVITAGFEVNARDYWDAVNIATAKGLLYHSCDVSQIMLESDSERTWNKLSESFSDFCTDILGKSKFEGVTLVSAAQKVKQMQVLSPQIIYEDNNISIKIENNSGGASFILLSPGKEPQNIPGVTCTKIHDGKYLIVTDLDEFELELKTL